MGDQKLALAGLDWLAKLGLPPDLLDNSRAELQAQSAAAAPPTAAPAREPQRLEVSPGNLFVAPGEQAWLAATLIYADGPPDDITADVVWSSSATAFKVDRGLVFAEDLTGYNLSARITATDPKSKLSGFALVAWPGAPVPIGLRIEPDHFKLGADEQIALKAIRTFPGNRSVDASTLVTWTSSQGVVSVDAQGFVTASGITGEQDVVITASDPDAPLTATATGVISTSHDLTLEITPAKVTLAPGGSTSLKAERVAASGRTDVTSSVDWHSSSNNLTIDASGRILADAKALQSETVAVTAADRDANLTASASVSIAVPSRVVLSFKTPFEDVRYFAGYEDKAKPRLENAVATFLAAEKRESAMDAAYDALMRAKDKIAASMKQVIADVRKNGKAIRTDAQSAFHDELREEDIKDELDRLDQSLADTKKHVATAASKLISSFHAEQLHALQEEAKEFDEDVEVTTNAMKVVAALEEPVALVQALLDLSATLTKRWLNTKAAEAKAAQEALDDENLKSAQEELEQARSSSRDWAKLRIKAIDKLADNARHAIAHWQAVERKYDIVAAKPGSFRFEDAGTVIKAGEAAMKAAKDTQDLATLAQISADDLLKFDPKPAVWLAQPEKDLDTLRTLLAEATSKARLAQERHGEIGGILQQFKQDVQDARAALLEGDPDEP